MFGQQPGFECERDRFRKRWLHIIYNLLFIRPENIAQRYLHTKKQQQKQQKNMELELAAPAHLCVVMNNYK